MHFTIKALILILSGVVLLRISGRKAISQMTIAQTVIMISIGTVIVQPIADESVWRAVGSAGIFVLVVLTLDYLQIKFNFIEKAVSGKAKPVIIDGQIITANLKSTRITMDQLEMRLRQSGISNVSDIKTATLEPNGQLGYELTDDAKPLTVGEFKRLMKEMTTIPVKKIEQKNPTTQNGQQTSSPEQRGGLFAEVIDSKNQPSGSGELK